MEEKLDIWINLFLFLFKDVYFSSKHDSIIINYNKKFITVKNFSKISYLYLVPFFSLF